MLRMKFVSGLAILSVVVCLGMTAFYGGTVSDLFGAFPQENVSLKKATKKKTTKVKTTKVRPKGSVLPKNADQTVATEQKSFVVPKDFRVSLFASEKDGVVNPVAMQWDHKGRLWVLCAMSYPHRKPGEPIRDQLIILEDTNQDGRADKTTVYVDKLNMPTGFTFGNGGVYLAQGHRLHHFKDTNGDDKADRRKVLFDGFGTGDTHQNVHSLTWTPDGDLLFMQGNRAYSRVKTAYGVVVGNSGTVWRYRPSRKKLEVFMQQDMIAQNPWGIFFDDWGGMFIKTNSHQFVFASPGMISTNSFYSMGRSRKHGGELVVGLASGKSMGGMIINSGHIPKKYHGDVLVAGYYVHEVDWFKMKPDGAGYIANRGTPLIKTKYNSFRPVDVRHGPDGAIYVADWFNPIIGHYQADLHHPDRDKTHGRIWRVTAVGRPLLKRPKLEKMTVPQLLDQLKSKEEWVRRQTKHLLFQTATKKLVPALNTWVAGLDKNGANYEHHLYEVAGLYVAHETPNKPILLRLLSARESGARAYGARLVGRWHDRLKEPLALLDKAVQDEVPRVRMEAVVACSVIPKAKSLAIALKALDRPVDRFLQCSVTQATHSLYRYWQPALMAGKLQFHKPRHMAFAMKTAGGAEVLPVARKLYSSGEISAEAKRGLLVLIAELGNANDLQFAFREGRTAPQVLAALGETARVRRVIPTGKLDGDLRTILQDKKTNDATRIAAIRLGSIWKQKTLSPAFERFAKGKTVNDSVRVAALESFASLNRKDAVAYANSIATDWNVPVKVRTAALGVLYSSDAKSATKKAVSNIQQLGGNNADGNNAVIVKIIELLLGRKNGGNELAVAMKGLKLSTETRDAILEQIGASGRVETALISTLIGKGTIGTPKYSKTLVDSFVTAAHKEGDISRGKFVFHSKLASCVKCHQIQKVGGTIGPDLSALGAGMLTERIVESILWPKKEVKEGYDSSTILTDAGRLYTGYVRGQDKESVRLFDVQTQKIVTIPVGEIEARKDGQTAMPPAAAVLTRKQFLDLVKFLSNQRNAIAAGK